MTTLADRSQMLPEDFEDAARALARTADGLRLEFINGRVGFKAVPDGVHNQIIAWLTRLCMQHRPDLYLYGSDQGLRIQSYRRGRARPDGTLAPFGAFLDYGEWADPAAALMTVEVTSYDTDTNNRDRVEKPRAYAETGVPLYLLIDRDSHEITVYSEPDGVRYEKSCTVLFGNSIALPDLVGIELDTEPLKNWVG
ncbi:Uma2 family endonuclease [Streptomyces sp. TS71-3]|uniref:Uma2 family endonuclease n=1 Tax=Streptomyces sp. TS71-3 TaxID=2733862 RepID=UPI001B1236BE|nr:Uma2 family endonuclease [Streptomyces sp. TS71-3]GHJ36249.1 hypothetical protein Sm713_18580 [Streptomyces sp. TS71-3]